MMTFFYILIAGLLGVVGHWLTRFTQGRTESTFWQYLNTHKANSISSILSVVTSSSVIFTSLPEDIHGKALMMVILGSYTSAYMLDSTVNKDKAPETAPEAVLINRKVEATVQDIKAVDSKKTLDDILKDDEAL